METPNYYAIIPANVRYDKVLAPRAILLYGEISALSNKEGYCWASNRYFGDLYGMSETQISRLISSLVKQGYIYLEIVNKNERKIFLKDTQKPQGGFAENRKGACGKPQGGVCGKPQGGVCGKPQDNSTSFNIKSKNIKNENSMPAIAGHSQVGSETEKESVDSFLSLQKDNNTVAPPTKKALEDQRLNDAIGEYEKGVRRATGNNNNLPRDINGRKAIKSILAQLDGMSLEEAGYMCANHYYSMGESLKRDGKDGKGCFICAARIGTHANNFDLIKNVSNIKRGPMSASQTKFEIEEK